MSRVLGVGIFCLWTAGAALAGGPLFTDNVTSQHTNPDFILQDTDGEVWALEADEPVARAFSISHDGGDVHSLVIEDGAPESSLYIDDSGRVGINSSAPTADLEIYGGFSGSEVRLTSFNGNWYLSGGADLFDIGFGTGEARLRINKNNNGVTISGSLIQVSSRKKKADIRPADVGSVLGRVLELPIAEWRYLNEKEGVRHMGPMAEDFRSAFELGNDGEGIALLDASGVALAAIQGLKADQQAKIDQLTTELSTLRRQLAELAATVASSRCDSEADRVAEISHRSGLAGASR